MVTGNGLMTYRGYAKHRGCTHPLVVRMVGAGRLDPALRRDGRRTRIDAAVADELWPRRANGHAPPIAREARTQRGHGNGKGTITRAEADRRRSLAQAELAELELRRRRGELVERAQWDREQYECGRKVRDAVLQVPWQIQAEVAACSDPAGCCRLMMSALRSALTRTASGELRAGLSDERGTT